MEEEEEVHLRKIYKQSPSLENKLIKCSDAFSINTVIPQKNKRVMFDFESEDLQLSHASFEQLKIAEMFCASLAFVGFFSGSIINDLEFANISNPRAKSMLYGISSVSTLLLLLGIF